jgi:hypothetical protein
MRPAREAPSMPLTLEQVCARLEAAAADAPMYRADGTFVFSPEGVCRVCGCTNERACPDGCVWAEPNLCSRCARRRRS